jgi:hypothetical protein
MRLALYIAPPRDRHGLLHLACPCCEGGLQRVPRRVRDRWLGLLLPLHRYRCKAAACGWEGNILTGSFVAPALLLGSVALLTLVLWASLDATPTPGYGPQPVLGTRTPPLSAKTAGAVATGCVGEPALFPRLQAPTEDGSPAATPDAAVVPGDPLDADCPAPGGAEAARRRQADAGRHN